MGVIYCPECQKEVSEYAETCPHCGFAVKDFMEKHNLIDVDNKVTVCPKCAATKFGRKECYPSYIKCEYCGTIVCKVTDEDVDEAFHTYMNSTNEQREEIKINYAKKYGNNQFDINAYNKRKEEISEFIKQHFAKQNASTQSKNIPKCPTCGSTNIEKISGTKRWFSTGLFGLGSSDAGKTMHCKSCGYKW